MKKIVSKNKKESIHGPHWAAEILAKKFRPEKIYLFGSRAYGRPHADSDMDLLVVHPVRSLSPVGSRTMLSRSTSNGVKETQKLRDMKLRMYGALGDRDIALDLLVYSPEIFSSQLELGNPFLKTVATKGVLLYDAAT